MVVSQYGIFVTEDTLPLVTRLNIDVDKVFIINVSTQSVIELLSFVNSKKIKFFTTKELQILLLILQSKTLSKNYKFFENKSKTIAKKKSNKIYCQWCGSELVLRIPKQGGNIGKEFYGCSTYPKCEYSERIIRC